MYNNRQSTSNQRPSSSPYNNNINQSHPQNSISNQASLSRFLSNSIINPLYVRSRLLQFENSSSSILTNNNRNGGGENPLFYSTQEGYEIGLSEDDDILPREEEEYDYRDDDGGDEDDDSNDDDYRLKNDESNRDYYYSPADHQPNFSSNSGRTGRRGRGIDHGGNDSAHSLDYDQDQTNQPSSSLMDQEEEQDENPFYGDDGPDQQINTDQNNNNLSNNNNQNIVPTPQQPQTIVPRHIMASHALSNLMTSEVAYGTYQNQPLHHHQNNIPSPQGGWKMYQTVNLESIDQPRQHPQQSTSARIDPMSQSRRAPQQSFINQPLPKQQQKQKQGRSPNSTKTSPDENFTTDRNVQAPSDPPNLYIYPTEARDIGSEVSGGRTILAPQTYRDSFWIAAWLASLVYVFVQSIWVMIVSPSPVAQDGNSTDRSDGNDQSPSLSPVLRRRSSLMSSLPILSLLITLTFGFCLLSISLLVMVKRTIRILIYGTIIAIPSILSMVALWTWSKSLSEDSQSGQGYLSLISILVSGFFIKLIYSERKRIDRTIKVLELSTGVIIEHPSLVLVSIALTIGCIVISIPFITIIYRLILNGKYDEDGNKTRTDWVIDSSSVTQALITGFVWSWTLNVIRNLQRIIISGVVSNWYFNRHSPPPPTMTTTAITGGDVNEMRRKYSPLENTFNSISRAIGPSLGSVCLSGFLLTCFDSVSKMFKMLKRLSPYSQNRNGSDGNGLIRFLVYKNFFMDQFWKVVGPMIGIGSKVFEFFNGYSILYCGITGFKFWESNFKVLGLLNRNGQISLINNLLVKILLNLISITISFTLALIGYTILINKDHGYFNFINFLSSSTSSPMTGKGDGIGRDFGGGKEMRGFLEFEVSFLVVIFGLMPFWIIRFVTDLISNSVDTLFLCWNIDLDIGTNHSSKTEEAFTGKKLGS